MGKPVTKPLMDIVVTHYNEPWQVGKKFFDMLEYQRCFDVNSVSITVVQDGKEGALPWKELLSGYSYKVRVITIAHGGVAAARNAGIEHTEANWIMFCDFDDMFADVSSLKMIVDLLPTDDYDMLWGPYCAEEKFNNSNMYINKVDGNFVSIQNKLYRRRFLNGKNIRFDRRAQMHADLIFNSIVAAEAPPFRIGTITTSFYTWFKTLREDSMTRTPAAQAEWLNTVFDRNVILTDSLRRRGRENAFATQVVKTIMDEYHRVVDVEECNSFIQNLDGISAYYHKYENVYNAVRESEREVIKGNSETEMLSYIQNQYNGYGYEYTFLNERMDFSEWLEKVKRHNPSVKTYNTGAAAHKDQEARKEQDAGNCSRIENMHMDTDGSNVTLDEDVSEAPSLPEKYVTSDARVAVFCGTYNTYVNMIASAKSLLYTTRVDRIYFLIEDDTFPYEVPDIIECINIKKHPLLDLFDPYGPNFDNAWTYMCLTRAIYTKLFPQYDKVVSFDIDVVIKEDVGYLWDLDMSDYYLAGVEEGQRKMKADDPMYINFGVVVMNLAKLRDDGIDDQLIEALNKNKFGCPEQDAFNKFCAYHIGKLPNDYNVTVFSHITGEPVTEKILHYAGIKYWRHFAPVKLFTDMSWTDIMRKQVSLHE